MNKKKFLSLVVLLAFGLNVFFLPSYPVKATDTYTITSPIEDAGWNFASSTDCQTDIKWNITTIPTGRQVSSVILYLKTESLIYWGGVLRTFYLANQTWTENDPTTELRDLSEGTAITHSGTLNDYETWFSYSVKSLFIENYGLSNFSLALDNPNYDSTDESGTVLDNGNHIRIGREVGNLFTDIYSKEESATKDPYLEVVLASIPAGSWIIYYDYAALTDQSTAIVPEQFWNGTKLLLRVFLYPYADSCNVTISGIDTGSSFAYIHPNATYDSTDVSDGQIAFTDLYEGIYEVLIDPIQDWHQLHISLYAPDGVGLLWESFIIYINNTRVPYPPNYALETGYYEYTVEDYFSQTVLSGDFTIFTSDTADIYQNWEVPVYEVSFHNGDAAPYNVEITRNAQTRIWSTPPNGDTAGIRLYGLAANVAYDIVIRDTNTGEVRDSYSLLMTNAPLGKALDYVPDDPSPGGASQSVVIDFLPWTAVILIGVFVLGDFNHRRSQKGQDRVTWRRQELLKLGVKNEKELSAYERRKLQEAEDARFGKRRFRRGGKK